MSRVDIDQLKARKELPNDGNHLVRNISALRAADEERRLRKSHGSRVFEGEIAHVVEGLAEDVQGDAEFLRVGLVGVAYWAVEVAEEELADWGGLWGGVSRWWVEVR